MGAAQGGAGVPVDQEGEGGREEAQSTRLSEASTVARWLGLGFREVTARSRGRALEIYSTTVRAFQGAELHAILSRRCARRWGSEGRQRGEKARLTVAARRR